MRRITCGMSNFGSRLRGLRRSPGLVALLVSVVFVSAAIMGVLLVALGSWHYV